VRVAGKIEPVFVEGIGDLPEATLAMAMDGDVVITMGAGSIGTVPAKIANETEPRRMDMAELEQIESDGLRGELKRNEPMGKHVSWRAGGAADRAYAPADLDDLAIFLGRLPAHERIFFIGLGSNLLVRDGGLREQSCLRIVFSHASFWRSGGPRRDLCRGGRRQPQSCAFRRSQ
jgi:hypothetical protein